MNRLVDARTLADLLGVSRDTVYRKADELGVIRIGGRLRFDPERVAASAPRAPSPPTRRRGRGRRAASSVRLLPIRESRRAA